MPIEAFEVIVSQDGQQSENTAVANAAKHLAYADQTDTFGLEGDVFDVNIYGGPEERGDGTAKYQDYGIGLSVAVPIPSAEYRRNFEAELDSLAKVETFERVGYQVME
jgi:hypothetical protein